MTLLPVYSEVDMPLKFLSFTPVQYETKPVCSCPHCGSEDYLISENGKTLICEQCGKVSKEETPEERNPETVH